MVFFFCFYFKFEFNFFSGSVKSLSLCLCVLMFDFFFLSVFVLNLEMIDGFILWLIGHYGFFFFKFFNLLGLNCGFFFYVALELGFSIWKFWFFYPFKPFCLCNMFCRMIVLFEFWCLCLLLWIPFSWLSPICIFIYRLSNKRQNVVFGTNFCSCDFIWFEVGLCV